MEYRGLPRGEEQLSVLELDTSPIGAAGDKEIEAAISRRSAGPQTLHKAGEKSRGLYRVQTL